MYSGSSYSESPELPVGVEYSMKQLFHIIVDELPKFEESAISLYDLFGRIVMKYPRSYYSSEHLKSHLEFLFGEGIVARKPPEMYKLALSRDLAHRVIGSGGKFVGGHSENQKELPPYNAIRFNPATRQYEIWWKGTLYSCSETAQCIRAATTLGFDIKWFTAAHANPMKWYAI